MRGDPEEHETRPTTIASNRLSVCCVRACAVFLCTSMQEGGGGIEKSSQGPGVSFARGGVCDYRCSGRCNVSRNKVVFNPAN